MKRLSFAPLVVGVLVALAVVAIVIVVDDEAPRAQARPTDIPSDDAGPTTSSTSGPTPAVGDSTATTAQIDPANVAPLGCRSGTVAVVLPVRSTQSAQTRAILAASTRVPVVVVDRDLCAQDASRSEWRLESTDLVVVGPFRDSASADVAAESLRASMHTRAGRGREIHVVDLGPGVDLDPRVIEFDRTPLIQHDDKD